jgi:hypothetical protein
MVLNMCRALGARAYLSGGGASRGYLDVAAFERAGIEVLWQDFSHPQYEQRPPSTPFVEKLSALDLLFNCGSAGAALFRGGRAEASAAPPSGIPSTRPGVPA